MRKVTTINLNGRAYQLEDSAYEKLQAYLKQAEARLTGDPDKREVLTDLEQAIADKCEAGLKHGKTVVSEEQITKILEQMGEVEADTADMAQADGPAEVGSDKAKKLYILKGGAAWIGICQGIGVYFGIDASIVRILFILLTLATNGIWILVYLFLAIYLPLAKTDDEIAEAYGKPMTAQDVIARARQGAPAKDSLRGASRLIVKLFRGATRLIGILSAILAALATAVWVWLLWSVALGNLKFSGQLQVLNGWREWLTITLAYVVITAPLFLLFRISERMTGRYNLSKSQSVAESVLFGLWIISLLGTFSFVDTYSHNFRNYVQSHQGYLDIGREHICVDSDRCPFVQVMPKDDNDQ